jgi:3'-phosphoadenosine 5'-phosphosulfate sulfotransferase (PAPS reductase)/FAD synthetase
MNDSLLQGGFDSLEEMFALVAEVNVTTTARMKAFDRWKSADGTKTGLLKLLKKQNEPVAPAAAQPATKATGRDPFRITSRTAISFSGGRTSAYLVWRVLQSNGGKLPPNVVVLFANTGKEREETLRFVRDCAVAWGIEIVWVEYRDNPDGYERVSYDTASRDGEPFEALIRKRRYLPNPVTRFCTSELKIRTMHKYLRSLGWHDDDDGWDQLIGIRADEPRRVAKIRARGTSSETSKEIMCLPLAEAGITKHDVGAFWRAQPFDLELANIKGTTPWGNCDLCYLKGPRQVMSMIRLEPQRAVWWAKQEQWASDNIDGPAKGDGWRFRNDRPGYQRMLDYATSQGEMHTDDIAVSADEAMSCFCGD